MSVTGDISKATAMNSPSADPDTEDGDPHNSGDVDVTSTGAETNSSEPAKKSRVRKALTNILYCVYDESKLDSSVVILIHGWIRS